MMSTIRSVIVLSPVATSGLVALFTFFGVFIGVLFWVYRKDASQIYSYAEGIPLNDEEGQKGAES